MALRIVPQPVSPLLARALCYRWAARLFFYPDAPLLASLQDGTAQAELAAATAYLSGPQPVAETLSRLWVSWKEVQGSDLSLEEEFTYLFARQVLVPPYESRYRVAPGLSQSEDLSDLAGFYAAFGFQVAERAKELPDHLSLELEFLAVLYLKEAYAREKAWHARARIARKARSKFLREHLAWWLPAFQERLLAHARLPFYPAVAALVWALLAQEPAAEAKPRQETVLAR